MREETAARIKTENVRPISARVEKWDILRGILMYLVILGHLCGKNIHGRGKIAALFLIIYSFHMPLFIFISGLFSKRSVNEKRYERVFQFLVIYLLAKITKGLPQWILDHSVSFSFLKGNGSPWYIFALAVFYLITILLRKYDKRWIFCISIFVACLAGYDESVGDFMALSRILVFYPFYYAGYCLDAETLRKRLYSKKIKIISAVFLAGMALFFLKYTKDIYFIRKLFVGCYPYSSLADYGADRFIFYGGILRLIYYASVFLECFAVISVVPERCRLLSWFGKRTLPIYVFHQIGIFVYIKLLNMNSWMNSYGLPRFDIFIVAFLIMWFFSLPVFSKITDKCMSLSLPKDP